MASDNAICRIGVFYDGSFFAYARRYYYQERNLGWLRYLPFHTFIEAFIAKKEQGYASYRVVYAAWHQGLFTSKNATPEQLRFDRNEHHDLMRRGLSPSTCPCLRRSVRRAPMWPSPSTPFRSAWTAKSILPCS